MRLLQAALNGGLTRGQHAAVPVSPAELAEAARGAVQAGARALHLHPRGADGQESLRAEDVSAALLAVREACPGIPTGISSGFWILPGAAAQLAAVQSWTVRPDFVSVKWHEPHALSLAPLLLAEGIGIEAGLWTVSALRHFLTWPGRTRVTRLLLELPDQPFAAVQPEIDIMLDLLTADPPQRPILLHGEGQSAWPVLDMAGRLGLDIRIGLEDTLRRPDGTPAQDNADLVACARAVLASGR